MKNHQYSFRGSFCESHETFASTMWIVQDDVAAGQLIHLNPFESPPQTMWWRYWTPNQQINALTATCCTLHRIKVTLHAALELPWIVSSARASMESFALSARQLYIPPSSSVKLKICRLPPPRSSKRLSLQRGKERRKNLVNTEVHFLLKGRNITNRSSRMLCVHFHLG